MIKDYKIITCDENTWFGKCKKTIKVAIEEGELAERKVLHELNRHQWESQVAFGLTFHYCKYHSQLIKYKVKNFGE